MPTAQPTSRPAHASPLALAAGDEADVVDVMVIGGGPAGLAAALWAARYRRKVTLVDSAQQRNRWTLATHGYLGLEGESPGQLLDRARADLVRYPEITFERPATVTAIRPRRPEGFDVTLGDGRTIVALRLVLATGVRDVFPDVDGFADCFGESVFTCASCDGYEALGKSVAVFGEDEHVHAFAVGLLEWASSVTVIVDPDASRARSAANARLGELGIRVVEGPISKLVGQDGQLRSIELHGGIAVDCQMAFCTMPHEQQSEIPKQLGCDISDEGCVLVDEHGLTSVEHVFAAGDMTPGPHLVQVAASKGAVAGIAAAMSLRGGAGAPTSSVPAPDADVALAGVS